LFFLVAGIVIKGASKPLPKGQYHEETGDGLLTIGSHAQERMGMGRRGGRSRFRRGPSLTEAAAKLDLSQSKQRQIQRILSAEHDLREENAAEVARLQEERADAGEAGDAAETQAIATQIAELRRRPADARGRVLAELKKLLTAEQSAQLEEILAQSGRSVRIGAALREFQNMGLNIKQEAMIDKAFDEAIEKIRRILTSEQREALQDAMERPGGRGRGGFGQQWRAWQENLTEEQRAAVNQIRQEYMEKFRNAEGEERWELMREMGQKMREAAAQTPQTQEDQPEPQPAEEQTDGEEESEQEGEQ
jgi:Spy/CpxP family protein refolding chaperone